MKVQAIPDEILFRAEAIGHLPEEYAEPYVRLIEKAAEDEATLERTIDEVVQSVPGFPLFFVLRPFMEGNDNRVKKAMWNSKEMTIWGKKHTARVLQMHCGT